jgi:hypothetical protein
MLTVDSYAIILLVTSDVKMLSVTINCHRSMLEVQLAVTDKQEVCADYGFLYFAVDQHLFCKGILI